uniref:Uncharacterized protein n=1 Tax=Lepeophtheirus salmonis TaxID=72036 RepID=A0A0K2T7Q2_LEPSM
MHHVIIPGTEKGVSLLNKTTTSAGFFLRLLRRIFDRTRRFSLSTGLTRGSLVDLKASLSMVLLLTLNSLERPLTVTLPLLSSTDFFTAATISSDLPRP